MNKKLQRSLKKYIIIQQPLRLNFYTYLLNNNNIIQGTRVYIVLIKRTWLYETRIKNILKNILKLVLMLFFNFPRPRRHMRVWCICNIDYLQWFVRTKSLPDSDLLLLKSCRVCCSSVLATIRCCKNSQTSDDASRSRSTLGQGCYYTVLLCIKFFISSIHVD